ncbi:MAG TPA: hypothetical protein VEA16_06415, partial [Vicinamibacterales bacterium]|nr:hypothetical protein [Vicinamibacterales bacterium]
MIIAQRFVLLEYIPSGIRARDQETAQTVVLVDAKGLDPRYVGIFHPALQAVLAIVEHEGRALAAVESVQGRSLEQQSAGQPCHPRRAADIVSEIADGVAELHARGLAHGNITQSTVLLTAKGKSKLVLTDAIGAEEPQDLSALRLLLKTIGGHINAEAEAAQSVA